MHIVILVTAKDKPQAKKIAHALLEQKLIACANILGGVQSFFWWDRKIDRAQEVLLILKTRKKLLLKVIKTVKANHSYKVPEIIALPIVGGNSDYLKWLTNSTLNK